jgi:hypothetical protein
MRKQALEGAAMSANRELRTAEAKRLRLTVLASKLQQLHASALVSSS